MYCRRHIMYRIAASSLSTCSALLFLAGAAGAQQSNIPSPYLPNTGGVSTSYEPGGHKSSNVALLKHIPLGAPFTIADIEIEPAREGEDIALASQANKGTDVVLTVERDGQRLALPASLPATSPTPRRSRSHYPPRLPSSSTP